jgi:hypothetical protein
MKIRNAVLLAGSLALAAASPVLLAQQAGQPATQGVAGQGAVKAKPQAAVKRSGHIKAQQKARVPAQLPGQERQGFMKGRAGQKAVAAKQAAKMKQP